jgi:hypothetical protein
MGEKYTGPAFEQLPETIRDRIKEVARFAKLETAALGVVVKDEGERRELMGFREVYVYDFGSFRGAYFIEGSEVYSLSFYGSSISDEKEKIERILGLNVVKRPLFNRDLAKILIDGKPLEVIQGLGHSSPELDYFNYQCSDSGPYLGRR